MCFYIRYFSNLLTNSKRNFPFFLYIHTVSDDNSSIQSSPWQRDHSWKQPSPRKNISKDLSLYYYRPIPIILSQTSRLESKRLRRQPNGKRNPLHYVQYAKRSVQKAHLSKIKEEEIECDKDKGKSCESKENNGKDKDDSDIVDSPSVKIESKLADDDEKMDYKADDESNPKLDDAILADDIKSENGTKGGKVESTINRKRQVLRPSKISNVIEKLIARVSEKPVNVTSTQTGLGIHFSSSSRPNDLFHPHQHVSPRKRILREFEKVSLEDRNSSTQKRSRSKSNASTDFANVSNSKTAAGYSIVVAQQTANIACNNKDENNRVANGSPPRTTNSMDVVEKPLKASRSLMSTSASKNSHPHTSSEPTVSQPVSKPISNYSIISLLGHNNSSNNNDSRNETNTDDRGHSESRGSPRSPMSYNHQILSNSRSPYVPKKKSPTNTANALVNSPTNYRNARSPDINSPSPGLQQQNSHHNRYHPASLSSPTSSFHPYLSSSRASPLSSGTLSPTDLYRHRSYRTAGSPSTMSNSSISGLTHQYASLNGSPTAFAPSNRYSPSTYSSSTKTSPGSDRQSSQSHSLSSAYNVSNLLPQTYDGNSSSNVSDSHRYSPNTKQRSSDWSPARTPASCGRGSPSNYANSNNSLSTTTIPKKTASIRQKYGSLSPNGFACGNSNENVTSSSSSVKSDSHSGKKFSSDPVMDAKHLAKRAKTPEQHKKPTQSQELYDKDLQARYNAEVAAMHHQQSLIASALQQQAANPFYHMYAGGNMHGANMPPSMSAAAAAAYMNPLYYHQHPASEIFRKTHPTAAMDLLHQHKNLVPQWMDPYTASMMHYPPGSAQALAEKATLAAKSQNEAHSMLMSPYNLGRSVPARDQPTAADIEMWNVAEHVKKSSSIISSPSAPPSAFSRRQSQQFSDCEPISLIKDEPSSGKIHIDLSSNCSNCSSFEEKKNSNPILSVMSTHSFSPSFQTFH